LQVANVNRDATTMIRGLERMNSRFSSTPANCGYLEIGAALEALEAEESGLGAAFYWELT
jgi:hypothetical protein